MNTFHNMWKSQTEFLNPNQKKDFHRGKHDTAESTKYVIYHSVLLIENATFGGKCKGTRHRLYIPKDTFASTSR